MKIALCQMDIAWENKEMNRSKVEKFTQTAAEGQMDLILFPEMTLTGFSMNIAMTAEFKQESFYYFQKIAHQYRINLGFGWTEGFRGKARNHYTVISKYGDVLSDYIKIHPFSFSGEDQYFYAGEKLVKFTLNGIDTTTFICYDLRFPEVFQAVSQDVSFIIIAANWPESRREHWRTLLQARAVENQVYIAGVNCVGDKNSLYYSGNTMLVDPSGMILNELVDEEGLLYTAIDSERVREYRSKFPFKNDRRPELYRSIL